MGLNDGKGFGFAIIDFRKGVKYYEGLDVKLKMHYICIIKSCQVLSGWVNEGGLGVLIISKWLFAQIFKAKCILIMHFIITNTKQTNVYPIDFVSFKFLMKISQIVTNMDF